MTAATNRYSIAAPEEVDSWHPSVRYICPACDEGLVTHNPRSARCHWYTTEEAFREGWTVSHYTVPERPAVPSPESAAEGWIHGG